MSRHFALTRKSRTVYEGNTGYKFFIEEHSGWASVTAISLVEVEEDGYDNVVADIGWKDVPVKVREQLREDMKSTNALYVGEVNFTVLNTFESTEGEKPTIIK